VKKCGEGAMKQFKARGNLDASEKLRVLVEQDRLIRPFNRFAEDSRSGASAGASSPTFAGLWLRNTRSLASPKREEGDMRWFEKLPTLSGVGRFIYILTNYKTISGDIEEYRRQIKDREDWARSTKEHLEEVHRRDREAMQRQLDEWVSLVEHHSTTTRTVLDGFVDAVVALFDSTQLLAGLVPREPDVSRELLLSTLGPLPRGLVVMWQARLSAHATLSIEQILDVRGSISASGIDRLKSR
jgi:hypothetical protein